MREIVGLDMTSAKEAFSKYLNDVNLDDRQIYFVNQIINYIVKNGKLYAKRRLNFNEVVSKVTTSFSF